MPAVLAAVFVVLAALLGSEAAASAREYDVGPAPAWVAPLGADEVPAPSDVAKAAARDGVYLALADDEVRAGAVIESYRRRIHRIVSAAGVAHAAELRVEVDPTYERLTLHAIRILRGDKAIDALDVRDVRVLQQEDLDERVYSGRITVLVVLRDVRVGDAIDFSYSLRGQNPVMAGHFARDLALGGPLFAQRLRVRLVAPAARAIAASVAAPRGEAAIAPVVTVRGDERETVWDRRDVRPIVIEGDEPPWFEPRPTVALTELGSWGEVARWAAPLFDVSKTDEEQLHDKVAEIRAAHEALADRALEAVRFVQDDVRYLGIEMGENSHRPHGPAAVLAQRFGDCKDKSLLLVTLLRALGVEAQVALVSTDLRAHLDEHPPSPMAFDHAIVRATLEGRALWIDATQTQQGGALTARLPVPFGRALVIARETTALETIPTPHLDEPSESVLEYFETASDGVTKLTIETTFRKDEADAMRRRLTRESRAEIGDSYVNGYARWAPGIRADGPLDVNDDRGANVVHACAHYTIPGLWKNDSIGALSSVLAPILGRPRVALRTTPLAVDHPTFVRHEVSVRWLGHTLHPHADATLVDDAVVLTVRGDTSGSAARVVYELRTRADSVPPEAVAAHLATLTAMRDAVDVAVCDEPRDHGDGSSKLVDAAIALGGIAAIVLLVVLVKTVPRALRRARFRRATRLGTGETAMLALAVRDRDEAERHLLALRCTCGSPLARPADGSAWDQVRLGERAVTLGRASCTSCGATRTRYFSM